VEEEVVVVEVDQGEAGLEEAVVEEGDSRSLKRTKGKRRTNDKLSKFDIIAVIIYADSYESEQSGTKGSAP
jgi:hypothetical protein